jgi:hypothetical protein
VAGNPDRIGAGARRNQPRPSRTRRRRMRGYILRNLISYAVWGTYLGLGLAIARSDGYLDVDHASAVTPVLSAMAAVMLWPLVFLGVNVRL